MWARVTRSKVLVVEMKAAYFDLYDELVIAVSLQQQWLDMIGASKCLSESSTCLPLVGEKNQCL